MSARATSRMLLSAFVAAVLAGLGIGLLAAGSSDGDAAPAAKRATAAAATDGKLAVADLPETPELRLGTSPAAPVVRTGAGPVAGQVTPGQSVQPEQEQAQPQTQSPAAPSGPQVDVTDEVVESP
ncbi:hypothetical protein [Conexibacter sp. SYSU D00693]|uniref:hypothetical protein n=1 Tax=Conexibacter sp. SYSU D00693 TaxID=2812560 RepID=UPI00196BA836|nr:hypothetical protein [Conexibacter sp. SYSU D00693]